MASGVNFSPLGFCEQKYLQSSFDWTLARVVPFLLALKSVNPLLAKSFESGVGTRKGNGK